MFTWRFPAKLSVTGLVFISALILCVLSRPAGAQGFMVKPMTLEFALHPGQTVERTVEIRNTLDHQESIDVQPVMISQTEQGLLTVIDPTAQRDITPPTRSCYDWVDVRQRQVDIPPVGIGAFTVRVKVPTGVNGFYSAGVIVRSRPQTSAQPGTIHVGVMVQFLVTILLNISGPQAHEQITVADITLHHFPAGAGEADGTAALLQLKNQGETCGAVLGSATLLSSSGNGWRRITDITFPGRTIFPGMTLSIPVNLERKLPQGRYRLVTSVKIGGRSVKGLDKEINYEGDPGATKLLEDVPIELDQQNISVKAVPGSLRSTNITLTNPTQQAVQVKCGFSEPDTLKGVAMDKRLGDDFSCAGWGQVSPDTLTLRSGERRTVKLTFQFPPTTDPLPYYYANFIVQAAHEDGQNAGKAVVLAILRNTRTPEPDFKAIPISMKLVLGEEGHYIITAKFGNVGEVHFIPSAEAKVVSVIGEEFTAASLETSAHQVLPLGTLEFSGALNFTKVPAGAYLLTVTMTNGKKWQVSNQLPIRVEEKNGKKIVTVIEDVPTRAPGNNGNATVKSR